MPRLLVVDDEPSILEFFQILLEQEGYQVDVFSDPRSALKEISQRFYDLVITDLSMPDVDGLTLLDKVKEASPETLVLMITAYATTESAIEAMKKGAYDYLLKPFKVDEIRLVIRNALEKKSLLQENQELKRDVHRQKGFDHFLGQSKPMTHVFDLIERVSGGRSSVLIVGESGTGKELVAKAIHENSPRSDKPFVSINCGAIPENLIESELFGYVRGAFTGASSNKMGLFEAAQQGTFFLDEVGELPANMQVKLLRVIQERAVRRIGSTTSVPIDVRLLSATNRELDGAIREGRFREDLYYRLNVIQIRMPALRERREDIPLLARHFLKRSSQEQQKTLEGISPEAMDRLMAYDFPGNVRELENMIEQSVALERSKWITLEALPEKVRVAGGFVSPPEDEFSPKGIDLENAIDSYEKKLLQDALRLSGGIRKKAAELLRISFRSMRYRLMKHGIAVDEEE